MKARVEPSYDTKRVKLSEVIPLDTPYTVFVEPTKACNFKCFYCMHSTKNTDNDIFKKEGYQIKHMDNDSFEKMIAQMKEFPRKFKRIVFSGLGEPLMNPNLPSMIRRVNELNLAERVDILTNASLLTPELSNELVEAGVGRIQISLQGLNSEQYEKVAGVKIDYTNLVENIRYLFENKKNTVIFIKIIDALLEDENAEKLFYESFGSICDQIYIEHLITLQPQMGNHGGKADDSRNLNNEIVEERKVCPVIFYMLQIDVDGNVFPCPVSGYPIKMRLGDIENQTLLEVWNSVKRKNFLKMQLELKRHLIPICGECKACAAVIDQNEMLDDVAGKIIKYFI